MSGWTPGPWTVQLTCPSPRTRATAFEVVTEDYDVAAGYIGIRKAEDAQLIAAAPELYEALEYALAKLRQYADEDGFSGNHGAGCMTDPDDFICEAEWKAEAALAKARGES